jgi:hypothetical protein
MCITFTTSKMSNTHIYVGEANKQGKLVHVLAYQNTALSNRPNAMVLPFPTSVDMSQDNVIDTSKFKNFLKDISNASRDLRRSMRSRNMLFGSRIDGVAKVFDSGSYTIVLATNVWQIPEALSRVSVEKRPSVTSDFLIGYNDLYPDQPIAVCCWNGSIQAEPLMWWYEPSDRSKLFIPTMDAHDGNAPNLNASAEYDHIISVGSVESTNGNKVAYTENIPDNIKDLFPTHVYGKKYFGRMYNGDCFVETESLQNKNSSVTLRLQKTSTVMDGWI